MSSGHHLDSYLGLAQALSRQEPIQMFTTYTHIQCLGEVWTQACSKSGGGRGRCDMIVKREEAELSIFR
jgi:hypothetical protein